jgi:hypothetical protein
MREQVQEVFTRLADEDPGPPGRRQTMGRRRWVSPQLVLATLCLVVLAAPLAVGATGDTLREAVRNGTTAKETEIIGKFNASTGAKGGYVTRQSNTQTGANAGGGAIYGCRGAAGGTAGGSAPCLRASNLADGLAFEFASKSGPAGVFGVGSASEPPFATNGGGLVTNLNADKVDGKDAADLTGAPGPKGDKGDKGDTGDTGAISSVVTRSASAALGVANGSSASANVGCNAGERLIGGGFRFSAFDQTAVSLSSRPEPFTNGAEPTQWRAAASRDGAGGGAVDIIAHALCAT